MQQFGFSATDEIKAMGRNSKIQQATFTALLLILARRCLPNYLPRHPLYHRNLCPNSRVKTHPFGENCRLLSFIPKVSKYQPGMARL